MGELKWEGKIRVKLVQLGEGEKDNPFYSCGNACKLSTKIAYTKPFSGLILRYMYRFPCFPFQLNSFTTVGYKRVSLTSIIPKVKGSILPKREPGFIWVLSACQIQEYEHVGFRVLNQHRWAHEGGVLLIIAMTGADVQPYLLDKWVWSLWDDGSWALDGSRTSFGRSIVMGWNRGNSPLFFFLEVLVPQGITIISNVCPGGMGNDGFCMLNFGIILKSSWIFSSN